MAAERQLQAFVRANRNTVMFRKFLVGSSVFLLLIVVGLIPLWLTNRYLLLAQWQHPDLLALVDIFVRVPALLLFLVLSILFTFLIAYISVKPLAIWLYLRDVREEQKLYRKLYTSLMALLDTYETPMIVSEESEADQEQDVQKIIQKQGKHLMLLGLPGAGKTITLRVYQHDAFKRLGKLIWDTDKIPVYVQMKDYNAFLKKTEETIDKPAYAKHVEGAVKVLGKFRKEAVSPAIELSRPVFPRSLRIAAMDILGLTQAPGAVPPLIAYLGDSEQTIIEAVVGALVNLGPELTFEAVLRELGSVSVNRQVQWRALYVLKGFLEKEDATYSLHSVMYQRIIEATLSVLSSTNQSVKGIAKRYATWHSSCPGSEPF